MTREEIKNRVVDVLQQVKAATTPEGANALLADGLGNIIADAVAGVITSTNGYAYVDISPAQILELANDPTRANAPLRKYGHAYIGPLHPENT